MILSLALPVPLRKLFDYLPPKSGGEHLRPGMRVLVPFGRSRSVALIVAIKQQSDVPEHKLKCALSVIDDKPLVEEQHLSWLQWVNQYYHHALGDTLFTALPALLRQDKPAEAQTLEHWQLTEEGRQYDPAELKNATKQIALLRALREHPLRAEELNQRFKQWRPSMQSLAVKNLVTRYEERLFARPENVETSTAPQLNSEQQDAVNAVVAHTENFHCFLLNGVTGSGKTEVYLRIIEQILAQGKQALVLVPEIGLTPQLVQRFQSRLQTPIALLHSGLNDNERLNAWLAARDGIARIVIGTRSAVFTPLKNPGVIIIDEEHDGSYKQQDGLRYNTRDIAITRVHRLGLPILLGSATPSLESLDNVKQGRYTQLRLQQRAGKALPPLIKTLDLRGQPMVENIAEGLLIKAKKQLALGNQVLLFLNRRGYAPTLICHKCGHTENCRRCDTHMTIHQQQGKLRCHHCGAERPIPTQCPSCFTLDLRARGYGTERLENALKEYFPDNQVIRIDRDTTRRKGSFQQLLEEIRHGKGQILLGTQMLAKGHDFPNVTLVGILDADQGLFSPDFRATERLAQLVMQVAGRAGRGDKPGEVDIQTHYPDHPLLNTLIEKGYDAFSKAALEERKEALLPPYAYTALIRAESAQATLPMTVLERLAAQSRPQLPEVDYLGPAPALMERRAGRIRAQLLLSSNHRAQLHRAADLAIALLEQDKEARKVRWSVDIDPVDLF